MEEDRPPPTRSNSPKRPKVAKLCLMLRLRNGATLIPRRIGIWMKRVKNSVNVFARLCSARKLLPNRLREKGGFGLA